MKIGRLIVTGCVAAFLGSALFVSCLRWVSDPDAQMSVHGYIAMTLGIALSLIVGCGLMILVFYSSRAGYDEPAQRVIQPGNEHDNDKPR